ncbi:mitochondrial inner membrane protein OXA1L-like [Vespa mandarinia]|uniref:mitochondrial inner membrane protein OXA1L-like n=1 Tax=Vespa mandarinia TaxID=7446 RepID=UPI00161DCEBE|nr:mitochondrial inner membrane protein OXA1L-like [Vespa mandarinia]
MLRNSVNGCCRILLKLNTVQSNITCKSIHIVHRTRRTILKNSISLNSNRFDSHILNAFFVRHASTNDTKEVPEVIRIDLTNHTTVNKDDPLFEIPDIPTPVEEVVTVVQKIHPNGEVALESLGLGGFNPVGLIQSSLEWLHISCELPWWSTIAIGTLIVRSLLLPVVIKSQRYSAKMSLHFPQISKLQQNLTDARMSGDHYQTALYTNELYKLMKESGLSPWKSFLPMLMQAPVFLCIVLALKQMTNLPVESLKTGGLWWFENLTVSDPYYILPLITSATLFITIEVGTDSLPTSSMGMVKYVLRCIPLVTLPISATFTSAILFYWTTSNFFSLIQVGLLRTERVRKFLNLPLIIQHKSTDPIAKKGFIKGIKESWENIKITKQIAERDHIDMVKFNNAGRGPVIKTYAYDPTKQIKQAKIRTKNK